MVCTPPPNFAFKPTAGRPPRPGLKPLVHPKTNGVTPLAGWLEKSGRAACRSSRSEAGASLRLNVER